MYKSKASKTYPLTDWCSLLTPTWDGIFPRATTSVDAIELLFEKFRLRRFYLMPTFDAELQSISQFIDYQKNIARALRNSALPPNVKTRVYGRAQLVRGLADVKGIHHLRLPKSNILPLLLPLQPYEDWMDEELSRLLYKAKFDLLLTSFELYSILYPQEVIKRLLRMERACFQFNYRALEDPKHCKTITHLLMHGRVVLLGTGIKSMEKACYYDLDYFLSCGKTHLSSVLLDRLLEMNCFVPSNFE